MPRLRQFTSAYPEIDLSLHVNIPLLDVVAEDADLTIRYGAGRYADLESVCIMKDIISPLASPAYIEEFGPFRSVQDLQNAKLLRSPLEPWRTWFAAHDLDWPEPMDGSSFNDVGLACDAAAQGLGVALVRLFERSIPSPHAHYLCWRTGNMDRWECSTFARWLQESLQQDASAAEAATPQRVLTTA